MPTPTTPPTKFLIYRDKRGQWRWYLRARNGRKIANGGQGYRDKAKCLAAIDLVRGASAAPVEKAPVKEKGS